MSPRHTPKARIGVRVAALGCAAVWLGVLALLTTTASHPRPAAAAGQNAAAVVVDDGSGPRAFCVLFSADSISGLEALQATRLAVTTRAFGSNGAAVCGIDGTGCGGGSDCLTCKAPDYWAYSRAGAGSAGFTYSMAGAASTRVSNGAVEGWLWGQGGSPAFSSFAKICAAAAGGGGGGGAATTAPPPSGGGGGGTPAPGGGGGTAERSSPAVGTVGSPGDAAPATSIDPVTGDVVTAVPVDTTPGADPGAGSTDAAGATATVVDAGATSALGAPAVDAPEAAAGSGPWTILGWIVFAVLVVGTVTAVAVLRLRNGTG